MAFETSKLFNIPIAVTLMQRYPFQAHKTVFTIMVW